MINASEAPQIDSRALAWFRGALIVAQNTVHPPNHPVPEVTVNILPMRIY